MPVAIMIFCYGCIIREVYITQKGTQMIRKRMDIYMIKMTIMMTLCFLVAWTPYAVVAFLATEPWSQEISVTLSVASSFLAKSSSFYNPIVYVFTVKRFRREVIEVLRCSVTKDTNATMATNFNLNEVKRPLDNQKESEFLLSDIHNKSRSEPSTDVRGSKEPDDNDRNQNDQDQNDQEQNNQECYDQEQTPEEIEQTRSLLVVSQVHESKDLALSTSLYDMPYMGPHIKGTLTGGPSVEYNNDIAMGNIVKKDTRVVLI